MATSVTGYPAIPAQRTFSWSGIFAGTFLFLAIEATFGILGAAVFATVTNPSSVNPVGHGISTGVGIWTVVLSIIALYCAGKLAGRLSGASTRNLGMHAGLVTFGMSIFTSLLLAGMVLESTVGGVTSIGSNTTRLVDILTTGGYWMFVALILGMIAAGWGGIHGATTGDKRIASKSMSRTAPEEKQAA
jgi:cytochrome b561